MTDDVRDFLDEASGSRFPAFKFANIGDGVKGKIIERPRVVTTPNLNDGSPERKLVVALQPEGGDPVAVWVKRGFMASAVTDAIAAAGATGLEVGGELAIQHHDTQAATKVGHNPAKLFRVKYVAPAGAPAAVAVDDSMFDN